jgi:diguanylate cyclase (GGDEF)-like protein
MKKPPSAMRLSIAFVALIAILAAIGQLALSRIDEINASREDVLNRHQKKVQLAREALDLSNANSRVVMEVFLLRDRAQVDAVLAQRSQNSSAISKLFTEIQSVCDSPEELTLLAQVSAARAPYVTSYLHALNLLRNEKDSKASNALMVQETLPNLKKYHDAWDRFLKFESSRMEDAIEQSRTHYAKTRRLVAILIASAFLFASGIAFVATRDNARELRNRLAAENALSKLNVELEERVIQRTQGLALAEVQARESLVELHEHTQGVEAINNVAELLESCVTVEEAYVHVAHALSQYFPSGALLMVNSSRNFLDQASTWGAGAHRPGPFHTESCWALRRGRVHVVSPDSLGQICEHVDRANVDIEKGSSHLCVPMIAHGESLGVIHVEVAAKAGQLDRIDKQKQAFAVRLVEQISLVLANLRLRETLKYQSVRDSLTGLFNRRHMEESLQRELCRAARHKAQVPVLMMDLDNFKQFNDTYGHAAGDILLREFSSIMTAQIRGSDIACRYGGEEFLAILVDATLDDALLRAQSLREQVRDMRVRNGSEVFRRVTVSIGVAAFPDHGTSISQILSAADKALYAAKAEGRDRVVAAQDLVDPEVIGTGEGQHVA